MVASSWEGEVRIFKGEWNFSASKMGGPSPGRGDHRGRGRHVRRTGRKVERGHVPDGGRGGANK